MEETMINYGGEIKSLANGHIGGYLVLFSSPDDPDLVGDYFTQETDFGIEDGAKSFVWLHHRKPLKTRDNKSVVVKEKIGEGKLSIDDKGVLIDAILYNREQYEEALDAMGWSSGTASHTTDRVKTGKANFVKRWLLGLDASLTPAPCEPRAAVVSLKSADDLYLSDFIIEGGALKATGRDSAGLKAVWTTKFVNTLPDSSFAYIEPGGEKDSEGKTTPRDLRHFPYSDADGNPDAAHVRNALARIPQSDLSDTAKATALRIVKAAAKKLGIGQDNQKKSMSGGDIFAENLQEQQMNFWRLECALTESATEIAQAAQAAPIAGSTVDVAGLVQQAVSAYAPRLADLLTTQINDYLQSGDESPFYVKANVFDDLMSDAPHAGRRFADRLASVLAAVERVTEDAIEIHGMRVKSGRMISSANMDKLRAIHQKMKEAHDAMTEFMATSADMNEPMMAKKNADAARALMARVIRLGLPQAASIGD